MDTPKTVVRSSFVFLGECLQVTASIDPSAFIMNLGCPIEEVKGPGDVVVTEGEEKGT